jgi:hypothetical protein
MNEILVRWHFCLNLMINPQERKTTVLATLNTLRRLVVGHTLPFGASFMVMTLCSLPSVWGYIAFFGHPVESLVLSWKAWIAALALFLGLAVFELVAYYELLYMRASVERKDSEYIHRYLFSPNAFWVQVPLMLFCAEAFAFIFTWPLFLLAPGFPKSVFLTGILKCFFLLWAVDFYRGKNWISRSFKSAFRLVLIFTPLLVVISFFEWVLNIGFSFLLGKKAFFYYLSEFTSTPAFFVGALIVGGLVTLEFFIFASIANTLYLRGKHTYSEDFFTK